MKISIFDALKAYLGVVLGQIIITVIVLGGLAGLIMLFSVLGVFK